MLETKQEANFANMKSQVKKEAAHQVLVCSFKQVQNDTFYVMKAEIEEAIDLYEELKEQILSRLELEKNKKSLKITQKEASKKQPPTPKVRLLFDK